MRRLPLKFNLLVCAFAPLLFASLVSAQMNPTPTPTPGPSPQPPPAQSTCPAAQTAPYLKNGACVVDLTKYQVDPDDAIPGNRKCTEFKRILNPRWEIIAQGCKDMGGNDYNFWLGIGRCNYTSIGPQFYDYGLSCPSGYALDRNAASVNCPASNPVQTEVSQRISYGGNSLSECRTNGSKQELACRGQTQEIIRELNIPTGVCQRCKISSVTTVIVDSSLCPDEVGLDH